jgi:hypothetical protein
VFKLARKPSALRVIPRNSTRQHAPFSKQSLKVDYNVRDASKLQATRYAAPGSREL